MLTAEQQARVVIDRLLTAAGWVVQDVKAADVHAGRGVALRELSRGTSQGGAVQVGLVEGWLAAHAAPIAVAQSTRGYAE